MEFACSDDSMLCNVAAECCSHVLRLSRKFADLKTAKGMRRVFDELSKFPASLHVDIFASLPCTPWCQWHNINEKKIEGFSAKLELQRRDSFAMLANLVKLVSFVKDRFRSFTASKEWPFSATGWKRDRTIKAVAAMELQFQQLIHGCSFDVQNTKGDFLLKPWLIKSTSEQLCNFLAPYKCDGSHKHGKTEGSATKPTGFYNRKMATVLLRGLGYEINEVTTIAVAQNINPNHNNQLVHDFVLEDLEAFLPQDCLPVELDPETIDPLPLIQTSKQESGKEQIILDFASALAALLGVDNKKPNVKSCSSKFALATDLVSHGHDRGALNKKGYPTKDDWVDWVLDNPDHAKAFVEVVDMEQEHRHKLEQPSGAYWSCVTRVLSRKDPEWSSEAAKVALAKEMNKLECINTWDCVPTTRRQAKKDHPDAVFSRLFYILGIKNSESQNILEQLMKARLVVQGNNVTSENGQQAIFSDVASAPTSMGCIRSVTAFSELNGAPVTVSDAEQAFVQPMLPEDQHIFVFIPPELWSARMQKAVKDAGLLGESEVIWKLRRPLYGLSISGKLWEDFLKDSLKALCWEPIPEWPQTFKKVLNGKGDVASRTLVLTAYVDDMAMGGVSQYAQNLEWKLIQTKIKCSDPQVLQRILGVEYTFHRNNNISEYHVNMDNYIQQAISMYKDVPGAPPLKSNVPCPWQEPSVEDFHSVELASPGVFASCCASLLMKVLFAARMVRADVQWTVILLSRYATKWTKLQDRWMCRLFGYLSSHSRLKLKSTVHSDDLATVCLRAFPDADLAGALDSTKSTSGGMLFLCGPKGTLVPLEWYSKKQGSTANSTTEAELTSANKMLREHLIPQILLWEALLGRSLKSFLMEDNMSTITVIKAGYSPALRFIPKHHRISLGLVSELCKDLVELEHVESAKQRGDILTKGLGPEKHALALGLTGLI